MVEVVLDREECTSCGNCVEIDDALFTFDDDNRATMVGSIRDEGMDEIDVDDPTVYQEASDNCQGECIEVYGD